MSSNSLLAKDSPFRRLPNALKPDQTLFLEGIRYSIDMLDLAYQRLCQSLKIMSLRKDTEQENDSWNLIWASMFMDAWSIIDLTHRLRILLQQMPGAKQKGPTLQVFYRATENVEIFRNRIQHINHNIIQLGAQNKTVWGALSWIHFSENLSQPLFSCIAIAGTIGLQSHPIINPAGLQLRPGINQITLQSGEDSISISYILERIYKLIKDFEIQLKEQFSGQEYRGSDILMILEMKFESNKTE